MKRPVVQIITTSNKKETGTYRQHLQSNFTKFNDKNVKAGKRTYMNIKSREKRQS